MTHRQRLHTGGARPRAEGLPPAAGPLATLLLVAVALAGCADANGGPWEGASPSGALELDVRNNNFLDVAVYALPDGGRMRLGSVTGKSHAVLEIPASVAVRADGFRLEVDPVGSADTYVTERIIASPVSIVVLDVGSVLTMSTWHLR